MKTLHLLFNRKNVLLTLVDQNTILKTSSLGVLGFKNASKMKRAAADAFLADFLADSVSFGPINLVTSGFNPHRDRVLSNLASKCNIISFTDKTRLPFNGCRTRRKRRL